MRRAIAALALIVLAASCRQAEEAPAPAEPVSEAWVRLAAVDGRPGAAYFTLNGGRTGDTLVAVESPVVATIELHESMEHGGQMAMQAIPAVEAPANGSVVFEPGGKHAMLFGIDPSVTPGTRIPLDFRFDSGRDVRIEVPTVGAGGGNPHATGE